MPGTLPVKYGADLPGHDVQVEVFFSRAIGNTKSAAKIKPFDDNT